MSGRGGGCLRWLLFGPAPCERGAAAEARPAAALERTDGRLIVAARLERGLLLLARAVDVLLHAAELIEQMLVLLADLFLREWVSFHTLYTMNIISSQFDIFKQEVSV